MDNFDKIRLFAIGASMVYLSVWTYYSIKLDNSINEEIKLLSELKKKLNEIQYLIEKEGLNKQKN